MGAVEGGGPYPTASSEPSHEVMEQIAEYKTHEDGKKYGVDSDGDWVLDAQGNKVEKPQVVGVSFRAAESVSGGDGPKKLKKADLNSANPALETKQANVRSMKQMMERALVALTEVLGELTLTILEEEDKKMDKEMAISKSKNENTKETTDKQIEDILKSRSQSLFSKIGMAVGIAIAAGIAGAAGGPALMAAVLVVGAAYMAADETGALEALVEALADPLADALGVDKKVMRNLITVAIICAACAALCCGGPAGVGAALSMASSLLMSNPALTELVAEGLEQGLREAGVKKSLAKKIAKWTAVVLVAVCCIAMTFKGGNVGAAAKVGKLSKLQKTIDAGKGAVAGSKAAVAAQNAAKTLEKMKTMLRVLNAGGGVAQAGTSAVSAGYQLDRAINTMPQLADLKKMQKLLQALLQMIRDIMSGDAGSGGKEVQELLKKLMGAFEGKLEASSAGMADAMRATGPG